LEKWRKRASCQGCWRFKKKRKEKKGPQGWERGTEKCKRTGQWDRGVGYTGRGTRTAERGQTLTFPQHEEVRLLVGVEIPEGRQGAPGLGPKELGSDVVQRQRRGRRDSQQCEPHKERRQQRPGARQPARRRHGSPSAPARRPSAALDGSRKAARGQRTENTLSRGGRTCSRRLPPHSLFGLTL
jgi:hypothetical protein